MALSRFLVAQYPDAGRHDGIRNADGSGHDRPRNRLVSAAWEQFLGKCRSLSQEHRLSTISDAESGLESGRREPAAADTVR